MQSFSNQNTLFNVFIEECYEQVSGLVQAQASSMLVLAMCVSLQQLQHREPRAALLVVNRLTTALDGYVFACLKPREPPGGFTAEDMAQARRRCCPPYPLRCTASCSPDIITATPQANAVPASMCGHTAAERRRWGCRLSTDVLPASACCSSSLCH